MVHIKVVPIFYYKGEDMLEKLFKTLKLVPALLILFYSSVAFSYSIPKQGSSAVKNENTLLLEKISKGLQSIAANAHKGVVFVSVSKTIKGFNMVDPFEFFFGLPGMGQPRHPNQAPERKQEGLGSGFLIDIDKGYILTNNHVIEDADEITIKLSNGSSYSGKVLGRDKNTDVAVIEIQDKKYNRDGIQALSLADSDQVKVGDLCVAMGAPFGLEASLTLGTISAIGRGSLSVTEVGNFIQTDAAINPGNSGGPLLNSVGEVIGINTAIYSKTGSYNGIGFTIPSNLARRVAETLINHGEIQRGYLGVMLGQELDEDIIKELDLPKGTKGALVSSVEPGGPADKAGIEAADVIVEIDGKKISSFHELRNIVGLLPPDTKVKVSYYRNAKLKTTTVTLGKMDSESKKIQKEDKSDLGISLSTITSSLRSKYNIRSKSGVVVTSIDQNSSFIGDLEVGDVIIEANRTKLKNPKDFSKLLNKENRLLLRIERKGQLLFVPIRKK